jgi:transposase-like protein
VIREYSYAYAAVSPADGQLDWMWSYAMNTTEMGAFLEHVSRSHADEFVVMVLDGAPSHRCGYLRIPHNVGLVRLPPYSPELNPAERLWDEIREKYYANRVFDSLGGAIAQGVRALQELAWSPAALSSLTNWPWIRTRSGSS